MDLNRSDHPFVADLEIGDRFDSYFVLRTLQFSTTRANKPYLVFDFTDRTGHIKGKLWEDAENAYRGLKAEQVVKVRATVEEYLGRPELRVLRIRTIADEDIGDISRFLPTSERDLSEDWELIQNAVAGISHQGLKSLLESFLSDDEFTRVFELAPAGKKWHHCYLGGLLEHTASMIVLVGKLCDHYQILNRSLMIAGAFLHDVGKISELSYATTIDYTTEGRLLGHIVLGVDYVMKKAETIKDLDAETLLQLRHLILSHQGSSENGSPVPPMTREAFVLYYIDEIDSKLNAIERELKKSEGGGGEFTPFIPLLERMLYKGKQIADHDSGAEERMEDESEVDR